MLEKIDRPKIRKNVASFNTGYFEARGTGIFINTMYKPLHEQLLDICMGGAVNVYCVNPVPIQ